MRKNSLRSQEFPYSLLTDARVRERKRKKKTDSSGHIFIFQGHDAYKGNSMLDKHYKVFSFIWHKHKSAL